MLKLISSALVFASEHSLHVHAEHILSRLFRDHLFDLFKCESSLIHYVLINIYFLSFVFKRGHLHIFRPLLPLLEPPHQPNIRQDANRCYEPEPPIVYLIKLIRLLLIVEASFRAL